MSTPQTIESMSYAQLEREERRIQERKAQLYQQAAATFTEKTRKAREMLQAMAKDLGAEIPALTPPANVRGNGTAPVKAKSEKAKTRKAKAGVVRYRDPANAKNVWTGRGPAPKWLAAKEAAGVPRTTFAV